jgi:hypothetical protein
MKICFFTLSSLVSDSLRRCVEGAFPTGFTNLTEVPASRWREMIANADLIIADVTAQNAAASYLIGLADTLGKRAILLAPIQDSIPVVFADRDIIVHQWNLQLLDRELLKRSTPRAPVAPPATMDYTPAGEFNQHFGDLLHSHGYVHRGTVEFDGSTFTLRDQEMDLPLVQAVANRAKSLNLRIRLL